MQKVDKAGTGTVPASWTPSKGFPHKQRITTQAHLNDSGSPEATLHLRFETVDSSTKQLSHLHPRHVELRGSQKQ
jgi:hypothetical protein